MRRSWAVAAVVGGLFAFSGPAQADPLSLHAAARMSPRPAACNPRQGVWPKLKQQALQRHCVDLASAYALVDLDASAAHSLVEKVLAALERERESKGKSLSTDGLRDQLRLLKARSALRLGHVEEALATFVQQERTNHGTLGWDSASLHDYAACAALVGDDAKAVHLYRRLVPVLNWLPRARRARAGLEAAAASLRVEPPAPREALSYLALVEASGPDRHTAVIRAALMAAARLALGRIEMTPNERHLLTSDASNIAAGDHRPVLAPSDWLLIATVTSWVDTGLADVWRQLDAATARPGHRTLARAALQRASP